MNNDVEVFAHFFKRLGEFPVWKTITGVFIWAVSALYGEFRPAYTAIIVFVIVDWIGALWFAWVDPHTKIESRRMREGVVKLLVYAVALSMGHFCSMISALSALEAYIQGIIATTELISIFEKAKKLTDHYGVRIGLIDLVMRFLHGRREQMENQGEVSPQKSQNGPPLIHG